MNTSLRPPGTSAVIARTGRLGNSCAAIGADDAPISSSAASDATGPFMAPAFISDYCGCNPDSLTISSEAARSSRMKRANASGVLATGSSPRSIEIAIAKSGIAAMRAISA